MMRSCNTCSTITWQQATGGRGSLISCGEGSLGCCCMIAPNGQTVTFITIRVPLLIHTIHVVSQNVALLCGTVLVRLAQQRATGSPLPRPARPPALQVSLLLRAPIRMERRELKPAPPASPSAFFNDIQRQKMVTQHMMPTIAKKGRCGCTSLVDLLMPPSLDDHLPNSSYRRRLAPLPCS